MKKQFCLYFILLIIPFKIHAQEVITQLITSPTPTPTPISIQPENKHNQIESKEQLDLINQDDRPFFGTPNNSGTRLFIGLFYSNAKKMKFETATFETSKSTDIGQVEFNLEDASGINVGILKFDGQNFGVSFALSYEGYRTYKSTTVAIKGITNSLIFHDQIYLSLLTFDANAIYRSSDFYIPFGINLSSPTRKTVQSDTKTTSTTDSSTTDLTYISSEFSGGVGAQFGFGVNINKNIGVEVIYKSIAIKESYSYNYINMDLGTGYLSGVNFIIQYRF